MKKQILIGLILLGSILTLNAQVYDTGDKVGIGKTNPTVKLEVFNTAQAGHILLSANDSPNADATRIDIDFQVANLGHTVGRIASFYESSAQGGYGGLRFYSRSGGSLNERMRIISNGNIGIGTVSPAYKLDVCGTIRAQEVKVDLAGGCDFVFKSDYKLMDLKELELFVKTNFHLPEIAPEKEMVENGVNMKELQMKLLQKMEEMTLYIIEQNKKLEKQNEKIETIEEQNKLLKQEIELLKTK